MLLFLFGFNPNIRHGVRLIIFGSSPLLIPHCLKPCQKKAGYVTSPEKVNESLSIILAKSALLVILQIYFAVNGLYPGVIS